MSNITSAFTVCITLTGQTWSESYFTIEGARRCVGIWEEKSDFVGAVIRNHKSVIV